MSASMNYRMTSDGISATTVALRNRGSYLYRQVEVGGRRSKQITIPRPRPTREMGPPQRAGPKPLFVLSCPRMADGRGYRNHIIIIRLSSVYFWIRQWHRTRSHWCGTGEMLTPLAAPGDTEFAKRWGSSQ